MPEITAPSDKKIKLIVNRIHNLPTPPMVFTQVNKVLQDPKTSAYEIGAIISEDPALSAKILKLTNSSFYGLPRTITSVKQAIIILGLDVVRSLVLSASVFETFSKSKAIDKNFLDSFWRHSLSVAFMARIISRTKNFPSLLEAEEAFSAGLLHDIGKLVIFTHLPEEFKQVKLAVEENPDRLICQIEEEVLGFDHAMVGSFLAQKWNLPGELGNAIKYHHSPEDDESESITTLIIHLSNYLTKKALLQEDNQATAVSVAPSSSLVWEKLGIEQEKEDELIQLLQTEYIKAETFLNMARGQ
ncbi:MAG: HDOD domain-containing protein [candidate division Zixibacteria bacterium]|nr:HDOD domain-containing protein [candidate division Zixibacteria bacterium]